MKAIKVKQLTIGSGKPKIAVSITAANSNAIQTQLTAIAAAQPDLVEWRIDNFDHIPTTTELNAVYELIKATLPKQPIIATFRTVAEGGNLAITEPAYFALLHHLTTIPFELIDIEVQHDANAIQTIINTAHAKQQLVIGSFHDFSMTPDNDVIAERFNAMALAGMDIAKVAVMPTSKSDVFRFMQLSEQIDTKLALPIISMAMGSIGAITRLSGSITGSAITFGSLNATTNSAPGQIPVATLRQILNIL